MGQNKENLIAAIELSTSRISGMIGRRTGDNILQILAYEEEGAESFIPKGVVSNVEQAAEAIHSVMNRLELALDENCRLAKVYVTVGGMSLHSRLHQVTRRMEEEMAVSQAMIDGMNDENGLMEYPNMELMEVIQQEYKAGRQLHDDPKGVMTDYVEGHFLNLIAKKSLKRNLYETFKQDGLQDKLLDVMLTPLMTAKAVLTPQELKQGVALIDFGAGTTTVTVYKGGKLRFLAVIPLGGENMTHDIHAHDGMDEDEAEELKKEAGDILYEPKENISGEEAAAVKKLNEIIGARAEEIVANVKQMLTEAKAERMQLVLTGGGANLRNIDAMVASLTGATKVRITTKSCIPTEDPKYLLPTEHNVYALIGTLATGKENCVETMAKQTSGAVKTSDDLFGYESTESKKPIKSDREKKQKDEEERKRIKEENRKKKEEEKAAKKAAQGPGFFDKAWKGLKNTIENIADDLA